MRTKAYYRNIQKLVMMALLAVAAASAYMLVEVNFDNERLFFYALKLRTPKLIVMIITAFAIGGASLVFQSVINNTIVTPCLLGMNSLYTLIHTAVVFFAGSTSVLANNANASFAVDLVIMGITATVIYGWLFKKTNYNVLYVLLIGTVLTSFFSSIQSKAHHTHNALGIYLLVSHLYVHMTGILASFLHKQCDWSCIKTVSKLNCYWFLDHIVPPCYPLTYLPFHSAS